MNAFDSAIYNFLYQFDSTAVNIFFRTITSFASATVIVTALLCIFILFRNKKIFLYFCGVTFAGKFFSEIIKLIVKRARPSGIYVMTTITGYSFPSVHATIATVFYGFILYLIVKHVNYKKLKKVLAFILSLLIFFICCSRVYLGVHYATDVIAGFVLGLIILFVTIKFFYSKEKNPKALFALNQKEPDLAEKIAKENKLETRQQKKYERDKLKRKKSKIKENEKNKK